MSKRATVLTQFFQTRKRIREMKAEATATPSDEAAHIDFLLGEYHDLIRKAEANIICPPEIIDGYFLRRISVYHEALAKHGRAPRDLEELRAELMERSRQRNDDARAEWQRAFAEHSCDSKIPLYYVRPQGYTRFFGKYYTPVSQVPLLSHIVERPELIAEIQAWLDSQKSHYDSGGLDRDQELALQGYCHREYAEIWTAFEDRALDKCPKAKSIGDAFKHRRLREHTLPSGVCLFEGQGYHTQENDVAKLELTDDQLPYTLHSRRPRSTSLVPNVALLYTGGSIKKYKPFEPPIAEWHAISPRDTTDFTDWANRHRMAMAGGCLIRYYIRSAIPAMSMWTTTDFIEEEAEVLLPPGCTLVIFKIERNVEMATRRIDSPSTRLPQCFYDVYHADLIWN